MPTVLFWGAIWLSYGSPFPATLNAKHAHDALGITGLGPGVDTWQGLLLMGRVWSAKVGCICSLAG